MFATCRGICQSVLFISISLKLPLLYYIGVCYTLQEEAFLEDINMMLNTGDIPNLYENEDRLAIIEKVSFLISWAGLIACFKHVYVIVLGTWV